MLFYCFNLVQLWLNEVVVYLENKIDKLQVDAVLSYKMIDFFVQANP